MLYTILCYHDEAEDAAVLGRLGNVHRRWADRFRPMARLMPTSAATTLRKSDGTVLDGPYAETKEQLLGFYLIDVPDLGAGLAIARDLARANPGGAYELRPVSLYYPDGAAAADATDP